MLKRTYSKKEAMYDSQKNVPKQEAMTSIRCCIASQSLESGRFWQRRKNRFCQDAGTALRETCT